MCALTVEDLRRTRQIISTDNLVTIAKNNGFYLREGGKGSHLILIHTKYPDIIAGLIRGTNKISSQRELSDAINKVQAREAEAKLSAKQKFAQAVEKESATRLSNIQEQLPHYMEAFYGDNEAIIVRDTQLPQIGFTLHSPAEDYLLENKMRHELDEPKRQFCILLSRSQMQFDMGLERDESGAFTGKIGHEVYDMEDLVLPPYPESPSPFTAVSNYQNDVLEIDVAHDERKAALLQKPFISENIFVAYSSRRGARSNHLRYDDSDGRATLSIKFETYSNQRAVGDGSISRISENELNRVERIIANIESSRRKNNAYRAA